MNLRVITLAVVTVLTTLAPEASARVFDSYLGRWMRRDPIGYADGINLYRYGVSAPLRAVDPMGTVSCLHNSCNLRKSRCTPSRRDANGIPCVGFVLIGCPSEPPNDPAGWGWESMVLSELCAQYQRQFSTPTVNCGRPCYCERVGNYGPWAVAFGHDGCEWYTVSLQGYSAGCVAKISARVMVEVSDAPGECTLRLATNVSAPEQ